MNDISSGRELYHDIFGSVLDRNTMTPYLLRNSYDYATALGQATKIMGNRGFDTLDGNDLEAGEKERGGKYIKEAYRYCFDFLFPTLKEQLKKLEALNSQNFRIYRNCLKAIAEIEFILDDREFRDIVFEDPRHLFLMASAIKYPQVFHGFKGKNMDVAPDWQKAACSILKVAYLVKSIEEDSQDINDYGQLGLFFELKGQGLHNLYDYEWHSPPYIPESDAAQRAFVKISTFFLKLRELVSYDIGKGCLVLKSGDGVEVDIVRIESRLKSPSSMFTKLGVNIEGEAHNIRDILAITFILKNRDDTLMLFHALQKRGVILQENTLSQTITQTLFDRPEDMVEAVKKLMISLSRSEGGGEIPADAELIRYAKNFYEALSINAAKNPHSAMGHNKFQCKLNISIPIHRSVATNKIMIPGTAEFLERDRIEKKPNSIPLR